jgi:hypothetical protein
MRLVPQVEKLTKECDALRTKLDEMVANNQTCVSAGRDHRSNPDP